MKVKNSLTMDGNFEAGISSNNSTFLRTKLKVFALGQNANGSAFSASSFASAKKSISLIPIVAKFTDTPDVHGKDGDLMGHNVELREKDDGYDLYHDTYPIGVISNTSNITIEEINEGTESEPNFKQYIVADEVYLWRRYEATKKIEEWLRQGVPPKVSMEIGSVEGKFNKEGYFQIEDFEFEAVAALGSDVTPAFPNAEITSYSKKEFKDELKELVFELNKSLGDSSKGGNKMAKETLDEKILDVVETVETAEAEDKTFDSKDVEKKEVLDETPVEAQVDTVEEPEKDDETKSEEDSDEATDVSGEALDDSKEDTSEKVEEVNFEEKYIQLADSYSTLQSDFDSIKSTLAELKTYKRSREEGDLKDKFSDKLTSEELDSLFTDLKDDDLGKVEEKIFSLIGKKNFSVQPKSKVEVNKVAIPATKETSNSPYGSIFD